ncbi:hypothetical protein [Lutimonas vermicola]|uniref:Uncharacterized protein n=1 Tax=Lutimonas vermicola TaxID=414288 RepID=A0ABU9L4M8_9FLAO
MADDNKPLKYMRYAIGEIVLVVIGILIALQINSWNNNRIEKNSITNYYERIISELDKEIRRVEIQKVKIDSLIIKNRRALKIIDSKNTDSIHVLNNLMGATATTWEVNYDFPITKEFLNHGYLSKIKNDSLKMMFVDLAGFFDRVKGTAEYNSAQYVNTIEPFFIKNINYSQAALALYKKKLINGGPPTNYEALFSNLELWNVVTFKLELLNYESDVIGYAIRFFKGIRERLLKELEH